MRFKVKLLACVIGSAVGLLTTYLLNLVLHGSGSFDGGFAAIVGAAVAIAVISRKTPENDGG